jgi:hypothetical protein
MRRITLGINGYEMPNYLICSTDKEDYAHILVNLCPYFFEQQAKITVQAINTLANIEILGKDDYIIFEEYRPGEITPYASPTFAEPMGNDIWFNVQQDMKPTTRFKGLFGEPQKRCDVEWKYENGYELLPMIMRRERIMCIYT